MSFPESFYTIDIVFAVIVLFFAANGLRRGLSGELAGVLTLLLLFGGLFFCYPSLTNLAARNWEALSPVLAQVAVFLILLMVSVLLFVLIRALLARFLKERLGKVADKFSGTAVGVLRGGLVGVSLLALLSLLPSETVYTALSEKSEVGRWVCERLTPGLHPRLIELPIFDQKEN